MKSNPNFIVAIVLVLGFIFFWDAFVMSRYRPEPKPVTQQERASNEIKESSQSETKAKSLTPDSIHIAEEQVDVILESPEEKVSMTSEGAAVTSWQVRENGHWVELINPKIKEHHYPLATYGDLNFAIKEKTKSKVTWIGLHSTGLAVEKTVDLNGPSYLNEVSIVVTNQSDKTLVGDIPLSWGEGISKVVLPENSQDDSTDAEDSEKDSGKSEKIIQAAMAESRGVGFSEDKVKSWRPGFIFGRNIDKTVTGSFRWAGVDNNHFIAAFIPMEHAGDFEKISIQANKKSPPYVSIPFSYRLAPGESIEFSSKLFVGPKSVQALETAGENLTKSVNYGFFGVISKFLLTVLRMLEQATNNFGWAIILITICLQIVLFPLTRKSLQYSLKMKELQPQIKSIQSQFKSDPKRLQLETYNFYRKNGLKFMGMEGCFPMLLQLPIFIAFYSALNVAYDLRGASWLWIPDLASADPTFVLPILMGFGMFLQQKLTGVAADPAQAKMMYIMPIVFTFLFFRLPAGLVLYWSANSIMTIIIQKFLQWKKNQTHRLHPS